MNHFMDYVCRGIVRSEDAIRRLNKNVNKLAKCTSQLSIAVTLMGVAGMLTAAMLAAHDKEIKALQKQVSELATTTEVSEEQEGA